MVNSVTILNKFSKRKKMKLYYGKDKKNKKIKKKISKNSRTDEIIMKVFLKKIKKKKRARMKWYRKFSDGNQ